MLQPTYDSISPAINDWYATVNDTNAALAQIASVQQQITGLEAQVAALGARVSQNTADEATLLPIIRNFARGQNLSDLSTQLTAWLGSR